MGGREKKFNSARGNLPPLSTTRKNKNVEDIENAYILSGKGVSLRTSLARQEFENTPPTHSKNIFAATRGFYSDKKVKSKDVVRHTNEINFEFFFLWVK